MRPLHWKQKLQLATEIATREAATFVSGEDYLPNPDKILRAQGGNIKVYREFVDGHLDSVKGKRFAAITSRPWTIDGSKGDAKKAKMLEEYIWNLEQLRDIMSQMLEALGFGYTVHEIVWDAVETEMGTLILPTALKDRPQEWFKFDDKGLITVVVQDWLTNEVLMVAWANQEAVDLMYSTGYTHFWSRSRQKMWKKGEESGHVQKIRSIQTDCDADTLLVKVEQTGVACHTGTPSCFNQVLYGSKDDTMAILPELGRVIRDRHENPSDESYTCKLFNDETRMCKKIIEEAGEFALAIKDKDEDEMAWELADLIYHTMVAVEKTGLPIEKVYEKLSERAQ